MGAELTGVNCTVVARQVLRPNPANAGNQAVQTGPNISALIWIKFLRLN
jgi:hypothetical protein